VVAAGVAVLFAATSRAEPPVSPPMVFPYMAHASATAPVAGRIFTAAVAVRLVQNGQPWTLVCRVQLRGYSITPHIQRFGLPRQRYDGRSCSFVVPKAAVGRLLHLTYFAMSEAAGGCYSCGPGSGGTTTWRIHRR
jgi:hypothetical protein